MVRNFYYLTALIAVLMTVVAALARGQPLPMSTSAQAIDNQPLDNATVPVCYIQLQNSQLRDLRRLCGKTASPSPIRSTQTQMQRPNTQSSSDSDDDDLAPSATPTPRSPPLQRTPTGSPTPQPPLIPPSVQPANSPASAPTAPDRPSNIPSPTTSPLTNPPSSPNPLAIPADDSR